MNDLIVCLQGFVDLSVLTTFNRLKQLSTDYEEICEAVKDSELVQVSEDKTKIKRKVPLPVEDEPADRTVYVKGKFPEDSELDVLIAFFREYFPVNLVQMRRTRNKEKVFKVWTMLVKTQFFSVIMFIRIDVVGFCRDRFS